jgi:tRNA modification GTPase
MFAMQKGSIYATASGAGRAAVAVIRLSGPMTAAALRSLTAAELPRPRVASLRMLRNKACEEIDRALVLWFPGPHSYTGEDAAELQLTGGRAVVAAALRALGEIQGMRPAEPGEFAWRAFENGKLDLSQVEGLADLVEAQTDAQRRQALRVADGALSREAEAIRQVIVEAMAQVEAAIDFSDQEDVSEGTLTAARALAEGAIRRLRSHLKGASRADRLRDGFNVVIAGAPNVGKSTLMNALARRDVAIVSDIPGTTRDALEAHLELRGLPVNLVDTAGIRETDDPVEREGVARARRRARDADLVLWLSDDGEPEPGAARTAERPTILIRTKSDLGAQTSSLDVSISARTGAGIDRLLDLIAEAAEEGLAGADQSLIATARHRAAFEEALLCLDRIYGSQDLGAEFLAEDLRLAARALERIAGRIDVEEVLGEIFGRLCIGK